MPELSSINRLMLIGEVNKLLRAVNTESNPAKANRLIESAIRRIIKLSTSDSSQKAYTYYVTNYGGQLSEMIKFRCGVEFTFTGVFKNDLNNMLSTYYSMLLTNPRKAIDFAWSVLDTMLSALTAFESEWAEDKHGSAAGGDEEADQ